MTKRLKATYDKLGDVLYVIVGPVVPMEGDGLPEGVELDFAQDDGRPVGVTVIGYTKNHWTSRAAKLADIMSGHLSIDPASAMRAIQRAVRA